MMMLTKEQVEKKYESWKGVNPFLEKKYQYMLAGFPKEEVKEEPKELTKESKEKLEEIKGDLLDDGKLNHSNNEEKKSPGRKKKGFFKRNKK